MRTSELADRAGVPLSALKYYQREGLLPPGVRTAPNQASYGDHHVHPTGTRPAVTAPAPSCTPAHVVLGGHGAVGRQTLRALLAAGHVPASVGRRPGPGAVAGVVPVTADLLDPADARRALRGAAVAYLVAGLPYSSRTWEQQWPVLVRTTAEAALENGTHLVHLDNVHAYGRTDGPMTEDTPWPRRAGRGGSGPGRWTCCPRRPTADWP